MPPVVVHRMGAGMLEETIRTSLGKYMDKKKYQLYKTLIPTGEKS